MRVVWCQRLPPPAARRGHRPGASAAWYWEARAPVVHSRCTARAGRALALPSSAAAAQRGNAPARPRSTAQPPRWLCAYTY